ncbi:MAG: carbohydrate-binding family 9-like protein [Bacteroidota bacterium]
MKLIFLFVALVIRIAPLLGQQHDDYQYDPKSYVIQRTTNPLSIDGRVEEIDWLQAPWTEDFGDIEGDIKPQPYFRTRAKMLWDNDYLYIAAELEEEHLWATYDQRDMVIFHENDFEVFIDPDGDTHNYYELEINALGTVWDLLLTKPYRDRGRAIDAWDIQGLKKGVALYGTLNNPTDTDEKWTVELALPWTVLQEVALKKIPEDGDTWRMNFSRVHWRLTHDADGYTKTIDPATNKHYPEYNWVWSPQGAIAMHQPETWAFVQFSQTSAGQKVEFKQDLDDATKWALRQIYYAQLSYKERLGTYASDLSTLNVPNFSRDAIQFCPSPNNYEVILNGWSIRSDGQIVPSERR